MDDIKPMNSTELMIFQKILELQNIVKAASRLAETSRYIVAVEFDDNYVVNEFTKALDAYTKLEEGLTSPEGKAFEQWFKDNLRKVDDERVS